MNRPEIKAACMGWLEDIWATSSAVDKGFFLSLDEDDLIGYHNSLCREMRNDNGLWEVDREIIGHPDDFSMEVLHSFREELEGL